MAEFWRRLLGRFRAGGAGPAPAPEGAAFRPGFETREVDDAEALVGELFRRRFHTDSFPREPLHFVGFCRMPDDRWQVLGYVHYTLWQDCALCGGLVIDNRRYRTLPAVCRDWLKAQGGVAELLLRQSFASLPDSTRAIWGHIGDRQSLVVCRRVGFRATDREYIHVVWRDGSMASAERQQLLDRVEALGPF